MCLSRSKCKICSQEVQQVLSFGKMPIANGFLKADDFHQEYFFELACGFCEHCKTFQLLHQTDPSQMFHEQYAFYTSTSRYMSAHFEAMALNYIQHWLPNKKDPFVIELGSNDGTMLKHFAERGIRHLGIEASQNVAEIARKNGVETRCCFFNDTTAEEIKQNYGKVDLISVANVHFSNMNEVAKGVSLLLKDHGIFVFENPYLGNIIKNVAYDQIYDEHAFIFGLNSVSNIFEREGLEVFHVEAQETHGGSIRYYLCHKGKHSKRSSVMELLHQENDVLNLNRVETYRTFAKNCEQRQQELVALLKKLQAEGKRVVGYAATAKSTTILNYCSIGPKLISCIYDTTPIKQGKYSPGMHIPIKPYTADWYKTADYVVLFAWNHAKEIFEKESEFTKNGGQWILFTPQIT
ncbi:MAG: class I SAM-dependent methyltransferase [Puniceicoccales bacterium]|jgi:methylation protein EvaC|nr:class I SAM-dependent methyltransferase [Puniceicoccales bacterium]